MKKTLFILAFLLASYIFLCWFNLNYILTFENISVLYEDIINGDEEMANKLYASFHQYGFISVISTIMSIFVKLLFYTSVLYLGYYLVDKKKFSSLVQVVIGAEVVNLFMAISRNINMAYINPPTSIVSLSITPLSLLSFFNVNTLEQWMLVPLSSINIFELLYIITISFSLSRKFKEPFSTSCKTVLMSYGLVTLLYILGATFISLYATK